MTYEKHLKVKNLKVKKSKKIPTEVLTGSTTLYGEDSGKVFTFGSFAAATSVTLPSAEVGRKVQFIYNASNNTALAANVNLNTKGTDNIVGALVTANSANATGQSILAKTGAGVTSVAFVGTGTAATSALPGAYVDLICVSKGQWIVSGLGYSGGAAGFDVFA